MGQLRDVSMYANLGKIFESPDDRLEFFGENAAKLKEDALDAYAKFGKGVLILKGQGTFVRVQYFTPDDPGEVEHFSPKASSEFDRYDPEKEVLVGAVGEAEEDLMFFCARFP